MKTSIIIPVKTVQRSKTRLQLSEDKTNKLWRLLLEEVIKTSLESKLIDKVVVVTSEEQISDIIEKYDCKKIPDKEEKSVNYAVGLAEEYLLENEFTHSIVLPLDVPFFYSEDLENLLKFTTERSVVIVPSRHYDGTNSNLSFSDSTSMYGQAEILHYRKDGKQNMQYFFVDIWPTSVSEIALSYDTASDIEQFDCTWAYSHWESQDSGDALGITIQTPIGAATL